MNSVKQIGFAHTVLAHKAIHVGRQFQIGLRYILEIYDRKLGEIQGD